MSTFLIAAGVAVGTPLTLLSLACLAALSAYRGQARQNEEMALLWARTPPRPRPTPTEVVSRPPTHRRPPVPATCAVVGKAVSPSRHRTAHKRVAG